VDQIEAADVAAGDHSDEVATGDVALVAEVDRPHRALAADRGGAELDRVDLRRQHRFAPGSGQRGAEGDVVGEDGERRFVADRLPGVEVDLDPAAFSRRQPAAVPAFVVAGPEVAGVFAFDPDPADLRNGFAAVRHLQVLAGALVDADDAEIEAARTEG